MTNPSTAVAQHGDLVTHPVALVVDSPERVRVWDPFVRLFHWSLAVTVLIAFLTGDELEGLHVFVGYVVMGLIAVRLVWG